MIREQNELNANTIAYNKQRQQITYKFKEIKFEVVNKISNLHVIDEFKYHLISVAIEKKLK